MSFNIGGSRGSGRSRVVIPPPSAEEQEFKTLQLQEFKRQIAERERYEASPSAQLSAQVEEKALQNLLARLTGKAPVLSPEEQARLDEVYGRAQSEGEESLGRFGREQAAARGMTTADSPIFNELIRQRREFGADLSAAKAGAGLDLGNTNALFNQSLAQFRQHLAQQAALNRQAMGMGFSQNLFGERLAGGTRRSSLSGMNWGASADQGDIMSFAGGLGAAFGCWIAAALYGFGTPKFWAARHWIMDEWQGPIADLVRAVYRRIGPWLAPKVRRHRWLRRLLTPLFDVAVRKGTYGQR